MRSIVLKAYEFFLGLFAFADDEDEAKHFGLGHVVILLSLAPYILTMSLYQLSTPHQSSSWYEPDISRFLSKEAPTPPLSSQDAGTFDPGGGRDVFNNEIFQFQEEIFLKVDPPTPGSKQLKTDSLSGVVFDRIQGEYGNNQTLIIVIAFLAFPIVMFECIRRRMFGMAILGFAMQLDLIVYLLAEVAGFGALKDGLKYGSTFGQFVLPKLPLIWLVWRGRLLARPVVGMIALLAVLSLYMALPDPYRGTATKFLAADLAIIAAFVVGRSMLGRLAEGGRARAVARGALGVLGLLGAAGAVCWVIAVTAEGHVLEVLQGLVPIVVFVLTLAVLRLLVMAITVNAYFLRNLGLARFVPVMGRAMLLWTPMLMLAAPYFIVVEHVVPKDLTNTLNDKGLVPYPYDYPFRDNALRGAANQSDKAIFTFHVAVEHLKARVRYEANRALANGLEQRTLSEFDHIMPETLTMAPVDSGLLLGAGDKIGNAAEDKVQDGYKDLRVKMRARLQESIHGYDEQYRDKVQEERDAIIKRINDAKKDGIDQALDANHHAADAIWTTMFYVYAMHSIGLLLFALVCIKSFMYVFARVAFHREDGTVLTLGQSEGEQFDFGKSKITPAGTQYVISDAKAATFYVSRRFQCRGKAPRFAIPQPFHAPIARLLHHATTMNKVVMTPGCGTVSCTAARGAQFIEWDLRAGEVVVFDFHNFVAMTEELQISTLISPRLSTLLLGKFIFSTATGPGKLVLMTDGRAEITGEGEIAESLPPERLVAMHLDTRLNVESELNLVDVYLSDAYVRPAGGARVIVDVDSQRGGGSGLARFFLHFLWPG